MFLVVFCLCFNYKVSEIIENSLSKSTGRKPNIAYGVLGEMMIDSEITGSVMCRRPKKDIL